MGTTEKKDGGKPETQHQSPAPRAEAPARKGAHAPQPDGCHSYGCKTKAHRFNFCDEHYDWFKFGLIKKTGEPVSDFEKKFGHYQDLVARRQGPGKVRKAA
jgi:hypothetical protein